MGFRTVAVGWRSGEEKLYSRSIKTDLAVLLDATLGEDLWEGRMKGDE